MNLKSLTQAELARIIGVTTRTIRNWVKDNDQGDHPFPRHQGTRANSEHYHLTQVINWLIEDATRAAQRRLEATPEDQAAATLRKTLAEAELKEVELARRKDELIEAADVERTWTSAILRFRGTLLGARSSLAEAVLRDERPTFATVTEAYDRVIYGALTELSELKPEDLQAEVEDLELKVGDS